MPVDQLDDLGLLARAASLLQREAIYSGGARDAGGDVAAWLELSERATVVLSITGSPGALVWLLEAITQADLHPTHRSFLGFPKAFKQAAAATRESLQCLSDDELCVAWAAFDRLQLLDKQTSKLFFKAATRRSDSSPNSPPRCSRFSLKNWVRAAVGLRKFKEQHPFHLEFIDGLVRRLLVDQSRELGRQGLQIEALQAVGRMTTLSSRDVHRATATLLEATPRLPPAQAALVPRVCAHAGLQDELLFAAFAEHFAAWLPDLQVRELRELWRGLLRWRVGPPGMHRSAASALVGALPAGWASGLPPRSCVRLLRALGRLGSADARDQRAVDPPAAEDENRRALSGTLLETLRALPATIPTLDASELLLAFNSLGQIARAWPWLCPRENHGTEADGNHEVAEAEDADSQRDEEEAQAAGRAGPTDPLTELLGACGLLGEAVAWQLRLADAAASSEGRSTLRSFGVRDLALLTLAYARVARRGLDAGVPLTAPVYLLDLLGRLGQLAPRGRDRGETETDDDVANVAAACTSAAAGLLMQAARSLETRLATPASDDDALQIGAASLEAAVAWSPAAAGRPAALKAVAAAAALGGQLVGKLEGSGPPEPLLVQVAGALPVLLSASLRAGPDQAPGAAAELLEDWHLDGCLHALAVLEALGGAEPMREEADAVLSEVCHRRGSLRERAARFWLARLFQPGLLAGGARLPGRLCAELLRLEEEEPALNSAVTATLRDCAFLVEEASHGASARAEGPG